MVGAISPRHHENTHASRRASRCHPTNNDFQRRAQCPRAANSKTPSNWQQRASRTAVQAAKDISGRVTHGNAGVTQRGPVRATRLACDKTPRHGTRHKPYPSPPPIFGYAQQDTRNALSRDSGGKPKHTSALEDAQNLDTGDRGHLGDAHGVTKTNTNLENHIVRQCEGVM